MKVSHYELRRAPAAPLPAGYVHRPLWPAWLLVPSSTLPPVEALRFLLTPIVTRMSLAALEGLEAVVGCEQGRWPEFIQVQRNGPYGGKNE